MSLFRAHFILFSLGLLFSSVFAVTGYTNSLDITTGQTELEEVDIIYHKVFPDCKSLKNNDISDCTVKPVTGSIRNKKHHSVLICKEKVNLLRDKKTVALWQKENRLYGFILLDMPEIGINHVKAHIIAVKNALKFNDNNMLYLVNNHIEYSDSVRPVTGVFIRHVTNVRKYLLKNSRTGRISAVNATPEHRFYVSNRQAFIPITEVSLSDKLITDTGEEVRIITGTTDREKRWSHENGYYSEILKTVYNLEVSKKHTYFVGDLRVFVHNPYSGLDVTDPEEGWRFKGDLLDGQTLWGSFYRSDGTLQFCGGLKDTGYYHKGTLYNEEGFRIYAGQFHEGERHGIGTSYFNEREPVYWRNMEFKVFEGEWKEGRPHGRGKKFLERKVFGKDFVSHEGEFKQGELVHGSHIGLNPVGEKTRLQEQNEYQILYIGDWFNGQYHGSGRSFTYDPWGRNCLESRGEFEQGKFMTGLVYDMNERLLAKYRDGRKIQ